MGDGERGEGEQFGLGVTQHGLDVAELATEHAGDHVELIVHVGGVGLGEDGTDRGGDHFRGALGDPGQDVAQKVRPAALHRNADQHRMHCLA